MDTRARILDEATRQLTEHGYAAFTVAAVRDALGLSSGSMFHAFPSKPRLAAAVYVEGMARYQRVALAVLARPAPADVVLRAWIDAHLGFIEDHRALSRYLFSTLPDEVMTEASGPLAAHNEVFFAATDALFARAADEGLMARLPRGVAQALCFGPAQEYGRQWTRGVASAPPRKHARTLREAAIAALASTVTQRSRTHTKKDSHP